MSTESKFGCPTPMIDPYKLVGPITAIEKLHTVERDALESLLAEKCMDCVEVCPVEEDFIGLAELAGFSNSNCFVSVMRAAFIAADGAIDPHLEDGVMLENIAKLPDIEGLS